RLQARGYAALPVFIGNLGTQKVGDIKGIDHLLAESGNPRRMDIEGKIGKHRRHFSQKARAVEALDLNDRELVRKPVRDDDRGAYIEGLVALSRLRTRGDDFRQAPLA